MSITPAYLGVEQSICGKRWEAVETDERSGLALSQRYSLPEVVGRLLVSRGVGIDQADDFLNPQMRRLLPNPSALMDMDVAANRLADAIQQSQKVAVFGDYDVDGATSSALLKRFWRAAGSDLNIYIPDRLTEGYGPNIPALQKMKDQGIQLVELLIAFCLRRRSSKTPN